MNDRTRPSATVTIEPTGPRDQLPRDHSIHLKLDLVASDKRYADRSQVSALACRALEGFSPLPQRVGDVTASRRSPAPPIVVGVEASSPSRGRPPVDSVATVRAVLAADGYRVVVREKRECAEPGCKTHVMVDWDRTSDVPPRWHSSSICDAHNYRTCTGCASTYALTCVNAAGQAPSVHCEVCGKIIVEWGASKIWTATLMKKGQGLSGRTG